MGCLGRLAKKLGKAGLEKCPVCLMEHLQQNQECTGPVKTEHTKLPTHIPRAQMQEAAANIMNTEDNRCDKYNISIVQKR